MGLRGDVFDSFGALNSPVLVTLPISPVPSLALCLSLCVVGKGKVVDMSNLAAVSDMHGRSPLVFV